MSDDMRLRVLLDAIDKATGPFRKVMAGSKGLAGALREQREMLRSLQAQQRDISAFREQSAALQKASSAYKDQRAKVRALAAEMRAAEHPSEELAERFDAATKSAGRMKYAVQQQEKRVQALRTQLGSAGINTRELGSHEQRLRNQVTAATTAIDQQQKRLAALGAAQRRAEAMQSGGLKATAWGAGMALGGRRVFEASLLPIDRAVTFESAMADVRKVVNFDTPQQFAQMGRDVQDLSMRLPMLPQEIAKIVAAAGQAGVARKELLRFAEDATKLGVAFDTPAEDAGQTMATWRTAFRMGQDEVVTLADKINYLGNTGPANVQKISDVVNRIGALGDVAGLKSGPLAALGATVAGMGIEAEVSATGIKNLLLTLSSGDSATKRQRQAFKELGIDARKMAEFMQRDASGAILSVLNKLRQLPKAQQAATMTTLFGRESIGAIAPLLTNMELLQANLKKVTDEQIYGGSMAAEYASRVATSANAMQLAKNTGEVLAATLGETLLPDIKATSESVARLVSRVVVWSRAHPQLARAVTVSAVAGAALLTVLGGILTIGGLAAMGVGQLTAAFATLSGGAGLGGLAARLGSMVGGVFPALFNVARALAVALAGVSAPVLLIGAAVGAVALLVWKYWGPISAFMTGLWQGIVAAVRPAIEQLLAALAPLAPVWDAIARAAGAVWGWIKQLFTPFQATAQQLQGATDAGRSFGAILGGVVAAGVRQLVGVVQLVTGAWQVLTGMFSGDGDKIRAGLSVMWQAISGMLGSWPARMQQMGADLVSGLVNGIRSMLGTAQDAVAGIGSGVIDRFKGLLGIHSPSRVFAELGGYTMQGLAQGLQRGQGGPLDAVQGLAGRMRQLGAGAALAAAMAPAAAIDTRPPLAGAGAAGGGAVTNHYEIHIHAAPGMDLEALAREVRQQLANHERAKQARGRSALNDRD